MLTGKIFLAETGVDYKSCASTNEIWAAVKNVKQTKPFNQKSYGKSLVTNRGTIFAHRKYETDIDSRLVVV